MPYIRDFSAGFVSRKPSFRPITSKPGLKVAGAAPETLSPALKVIGQIRRRELDFCDANPALSSLSDSAQDPHRAYSTQTGITPSVLNMAPGLG